MLQWLQFGRLHWLHHGDASGSHLACPQENFFSNLDRSKFEKSNKAENFVRKEKVEILDKKRCLVVDGRDATLALEQEEAVFPACIAPMELYGELISSYSATSVVDLSPAQGEFLKACLAARTKCLAVVHTDSHAKHLELLCTDFVLSELSREGSTFFRPEAVAKDDDEVESEEKAAKKTKKEKEKKDKKEKESDKKPPKRKGEEDGAEGKKPPKKPKQEKKTKEEEKAEKKSSKDKKPKKNKEESDAEEGSDTSSAMW